ncbi:MAG: hypothetical protein K0Q79_2596 [Flavipsychrobacter sp.]|jgi:hypothetical protein|nr:hypothetical protein [Flavipsychrobacter sp.]
MKGLLAIEWLKVKRYRTFWVLIGLFALLLPIWNYEIASGFLQLGSKNSINIIDTAYSFPGVWGNLGFWGSVFVLFLSILVIIITTNEYAYRTHRQNVIDGWRREQFLNAKVLIVFALCIAATVFLFLLGVIFGVINSGSLDGMFTEIEQVGYFFLLSLNYMGFALFIAIWIKRSGLAIGLFLLYAMIIENIAKGIGNHFMDLPLFNLLPLQASDELLPFPLMAMAKNLINGGPSVSMNTYVIVTVIWCVVYYFAAKLLLLKRDW